MRTAIRRAAIGLLLATTMIAVTRPASVQASWLDAKAENPQIEVGIRDLLRQYSTALEQLDADAVKKVQPSIELENLRKAFREMRALNVTIDDVRVLASDSVVARVSCRVTQTLTPKAGSKQTTALTRVMRLRRQSDSWTIESFER